MGNLLYSLFPAAFLIFVKVTRRRFEQINVSVKKKMSNVLGSVFGRHVTGDRVACRVWGGVSYELNGQIASQRLQWMKVSPSRESRVRSPGSRQSDTWTEGQSEGWLVGGRRTQTGDNSVHVRVHVPRPGAAHVLVHGPVKLQRVGGKCSCSVLWKMGNVKRLLPFAVAVAC